MKRLFVAGTVACIMIFVGSVSLFAGGSKEQKAAPTVQPVTIEVWNYATGEEQKTFQAAYDEFNGAQTAVKINATWGVDNQKIITSISGGSPPDVVDLGGADPLASWAAKGALLSLNSRIKASNLDTNAFVPAALSYGKSGDTYYGITGAFDGLFLYYNKDLLAAAKIAPPTTIAELDKAAEALTKESGGKIAQLGFSPTGGISGDDGLQVWAYTFGGDWWNPTTKAVTPTEPGNIAALKWEMSYYKKYGAQALNDFNSASYGSGPLGSDPFAFGKVAMEVGGEWLNAFLHNYAPNVNFGEVPLPVLKAGNKPRMYPNGDVWIIPATAKNPDAAWAFIMWLEQPKHYAPILNQMVNLPQFKSLYQDVSWAGGPLQQSVKLQNQYEMVAMPQLANFVKYESLIANAEQQATNGKMTAEQALGQIAGELGQ